MALPPQIQQAEESVKKAVDAAKPYLKVGTAPTPALLLAPREETVFLLAQNSTEQSAATASRPPSAAAILVSAAAAVAAATGCLACSALPIRTRPASNSQWLPRQMALTFSQHSLSGPATLPTPLQTLLHWGYIPAIIAGGMLLTEPRPSWVQLLGPM